MTYPRLIGMEKSKFRVKELCEEAKEIAINLSGNTDNLIKLSSFMSKRKY